jgi:hypothetical protein
MRKPIEDRILTIPKPTKEEIFEKYEYSLNYISYILLINDYSEAEKLYLIGYMTKIALDKSIKIGKFKNVELKNVELKNVGETVKIDLGFWNQKGEYIEDLQEVDFEKE